MGPGERLFEPAKDDLVNATQEHPVASSAWMSALVTMVQFPESFVQRASNTWQTELWTCPHKLGLMGLPVTPWYIKEYYLIPEEDWNFIEDILKADPNERPTASELVNHSWLIPSLETSLEDWAVAVSGT